MRTGERDVSSGANGTHRKRLAIRTRVERPSRSPMWIAAIAICLVAASAIVAAVHAIPASYANIPDEPGRAPPGSENAYSDDPQAHLAVARDAVNGRNPARCPECGFVESIRPIEDAGDVGVAEGVSGGAIAGGIAKTRQYEITIRARDGSTTVFNEATPRAWRLGSRVIVIGGSKASND
jgi:hypothetical protein